MGFSLDFLKVWIKGLVVENSLSFPMMNVLNDALVSFLLLGIKCGALYFYGNARSTDVHIAAGAYNEK